VIDVPSFAHPTPYYQDDLVTLYHGDCRETAEWWIDADVVVTDPPYGMGFRSGRGGAFGASTVASDEDTAARDYILSIWHTDTHPRPALIFGRWSIDRPPGTRMVLTWEKGEHVGMGDLSLPWKPNTEEIYVLGSGFTGNRTGSVLKCHAIAGTVGQAGKGTRHHPTEKPVPLMAELVRKCPPGVIADPFAGSGSTLVAVKQEGRSAIGVELDERYCEVIAKRLQNADVTLFGGVA
jgi:site-specific DNA-methyltransferase (adenine-specific)